MLRLATVSLMLALGAAQQPFSDLQSQPTGDKAPAVRYLYPEQVTITAGKPSPVDLHFKIAQGLHINSHLPRTEDLIPTTLTVPAESGVHLANADFPPGVEFAFELNPKEKLSVYTGEFEIHAELVAPKGEHLVQASLRYQACTNSTCMPPHTIPVAIDVIAK